MAIKKTQLYSILWESCNILRGSMDASQYKNYVLTILFLKYISDKVKAGSDLYFELPEGCSFNDIVALKQKANIGEEIQKRLHLIAKANPNLDNIINEADFDDSTKLGSGKAKVDTLSNLIAVFQKDFLDFSSNRAGDDDIIGDAYEYLMKNFAAESGKKKGQFYTPAEVSRLMAMILGIHQDSRDQISIYDPTCGSGSLLLRAKAEAQNGVSILGQELDGATRGMAVMNMYLHGVDDAEIEVGDTIEKPFFKDAPNELMKFDYAVANPPFSQKGWIKGEVKINDTYGRWGTDDSLPPIPPAGYEDYAFLLHIIKSLKSQGRAACILPNGVLFRGNEEENVRRKLIGRRYIRGIISLPSNLFFGTGIPACIIIIDKAKALTSKGIFMIDAREGFIKDGAKNRLREQDIRRIFDTWQTLETLEANGKLDDNELFPHFARFVPYSEITNERNDCNLNVSRYISPRDTEIQHDLYAHLKLNGGLPANDVDNGFEYVWRLCPTLKNELFAPFVPGYYRLAVDRKEVGNAISFNKEFRTLSGFFSDSIEEWFNLIKPQLFSLAPGCNPKQLMTDWSEALLETLGEVDGMVDAYDVYDILMNYWHSTMQDDCYLISRDGWKVELSCETLTTDKKSKEVKFVAKKNPTFRDYNCDLLPVDIVVTRYFKNEHDAVLKAEECVAQFNSEIEQMEEENSETLDDTVAGLKKTLKNLEKTAPDDEDVTIIRDYLSFADKLKVAKKTAKDAVAKLTALVVKKYPTLTDEEIKDMVVNEKWHTFIVGEAINESLRVTFAIEGQVTALADRYARRLADIDFSVRSLEERVNSHLAKMGFEL